MKMDLIDRQAALDAIAKKAREELADANHYVREDVQIAIDAIESVPGAEQKPYKEADEPKIKRPKSLGFDTVGGWR